MNTYYDFLLQYPELESLRDRFSNVVDIDIIDSLKSEKIHVSFDTKMRATFTYFFLGESLSEIAKFFWVHRTTIKRWIDAVFDARNSHFVSRPRGRSPILSEHDIDFIELVLEQTPLLFFKGDTDVSVSTIHRVLVLKRNFSRKKASLLVKRVRRAALVGFENRFNLRFGLVWQQQLVFIDEISFKGQHCTREYGWSKKNCPIVAQQPSFPDKQVSFVVATTVNGYLYSEVKEGHFSRLDFVGFLSNLINFNLLSTTGGPRSCLILDGCRIHCHANIYDAMNLANVDYLILPPYAPEMNPIEAFFGELRQKVRNHAVNFPDDVGVSLIRQVLTDEMSTCCRRRLNHAGYEQGKPYRSPYLYNPKLENNEFLYFDAFFLSLFNRFLINKILNYI
ncbi:hypothetical protein GEMRC1_005443 [Eukaryota sp. GEM-RC1]